MPKKDTSCKLPYRPSWDKVSSYSDSFLKGMEEAASIDKKEQEVRWGAGPVVTASTCPTGIALKKDSGGVEFIPLTPANTTEVPVNYADEHLGGISFYVKHGDEARLCVKSDDPDFAEDSDKAEREAMVAKQLALIAQQEQLKKVAAKNGSTETVATWEKTVSLLSDEAIMEGMRLAASDQKKAIAKITKQLKRLAQEDRSLAWLTEYKIPSASGSGVTNGFAAAIVQCALADNEEMCKSDTVSPGMEQVSDASNKNLCRTVRWGKRSLCVPRAPADATQAWEVPRVSDENQKQEVLAAAEAKAMKDSINDLTQQSSFANSRTKKKAKEVIMGSVLTALKKREENAANGNREMEAIGAGVGLTSADMKKMNLTGGATGGSGDDDDGTGSVMQALLFGEGMRGGAAQPQPRLSSWMEGGGGDDDDVYGYGYGSDGGDSVGSDDSYVSFHEALKKSLPSLEGGAGLDFFDAAGWV